MAFLGKEVQENNWVRTIAWWAQVSEAADEQRLVLGTERWIHSLEGRIGQGADAGAADGATADAWLGLRLRVKGLRRDEA